MADTKKEHYVPRCYLKNFILENDKIQVFDKYKMQVRSQRIMDVAMENYFYDIKFDEFWKKAEPHEQEKIKADVLKIAGTDDWSEVLEILDEKHIEKKFFGSMESVYGQLLQSLIRKSYKGSQWVIEHCLACSEMEKELMSLFIAIQMIRTKAFRDNLSDMIEKLYQTLAYKMQMHDENALSKEAFLVDVDKDFVKLQHSSMILDEDMSVHFAEILNSHIWVMYVNKTNCPFYTSDNPVVNIPHKFDQYMSYGGLQSEGVEIVLPITPDLLLAMYERSTYSEMFTDRRFIALTSKEQIDFYNRAQVVNSYRCVFSGINNFGLAEKVCTEHPELQERQLRVEVS